MDIYITLRSGSVQTRQPNEDKIADSLNLVPLQKQEVVEVSTVEPPKDQQADKD